MKPFWEDEYLNKEKSTFGNPSKEVKELVPYLKKDAKILDVGCGDGRHALYLADAAKIEIENIRDAKAPKRNEQCQSHSSSGTWRRRQIPRKDR